MFFRMQLQTVVLAGICATLSSAQTLNISTRVGSIISLSSPSSISGSIDLGNREYDRRRDCNTDDDTSSANAVFVLENVATLSNVIIGVRQLEGVHCKAACTLKNVWFRVVCEGMRYCFSPFLFILHNCVFGSVDAISFSVPVTSSSKEVVQRIHRIKSSSTTERVRSLLKTSRQLVLARFTVPVATVRTMADPERSSSRDSKPTVSPLMFSVSTRTTAILQLSQDHADRVSRTSANSGRASTKSWQALVQQSLPPRTAALVRRENLRRFQPAG